MFTLSRGIDPKYRTNQIILLASLLLATAGYFTTRELGLSVQMGGSLFLTWALVREIDCKREYAAILAAVFTAFNLFIPFKIGLGTIFLMILLLRSINHITGKKGTLIDFLSLIGLATYISYSSQNSIYIFLVFISVLFNIKEDENKKQNLMFMAISFLLYAVLSLGFNYFIYFGEIFSSLPLILFFGISLLFYFIYILTDQDKATLNDAGKAASVRKILNGQMYYGFAVFLLLVFSELPSGTIVVFFSAIYGLIIFGLYDQFRKKTQNNS